MRHREREVWAAYQRHARHLDALYSPPGTSPILDRLQSFTPTRGLVYGAYGEASADVHDLIGQAATALARAQWRLLGARSESELRSFMLSRARRRVGLAAVQAFARHRIARLPYIGVPRALVVGRPAAQQPQPQIAAPVAHEFFAGQRLGAPDGMYGEF